MESAFWNRHPRVGSKSVETRTDGMTYAVVRISCWWVGAKHSAMQSHNLYFPTRMKSRNVDSGGTWLRTHFGTLGFCKGGVRHAEFTGFGVWNRRPWVGSEPVGLR